MTNYPGNAPGCTPHAYNAGDGFIDPGGRDVHMLRNESNAPAETIAVQLLPKVLFDAPLSTRQVAAPPEEPD